MPVPGDDVAALEPLKAIEGETPDEREARFYVHINRHLGARDTALRSYVTNEIARVRREGERMDQALTSLEGRVVMEARLREEEHRRLDSEVREIPMQLIALKDQIIATKGEIIREIQGRQDPAPTASPPATPLISTPPTLGTLVLHSRPVQALVVAAAALMAAAAVALLAVAIGQDKAAQIAGHAVDKIPTVRVESKAPPAPVEPAPGEAPEPQP